MKSITALAGTVVLAGAMLATTVPATAASAAPTLTAPAGATYYSTVTLTGTTPEPDEAVELLFRTAGTPDYIARRHLTSDDTGNFTTTYAAVSTQYIAARADGVNSYVHVVHVPTAHCTASAPAFTAVPNTAGHPGVTDNALFTTTRDGVWAGESYAAHVGELDLITWQSGAPHVVARQPYPGFTYDYALTRVVGLTPNHAVIASVQDVAAHRALRGYYWYAGARYPMSHGPWLAWAPVAVSDSGATVGWAEAGTAAHPRYYSILWPHAGDPYQVLGSHGATKPAVAIDGRGDIAWSTATDDAVLRTVEGHTHELQAFGPLSTVQDWTARGVHPTAASVNAFYASYDEHVVRWVVHPESADGPMHGLQIAGPSARTVDVVGRANDAVLGESQEYLRTARGAYTGTPTQAFDGVYGFNAVDIHGAMAYTAYGDRRVRLLRCTTS